MSSPVSIPVPAATRGADVKVRVTRESVRVVVAGHALQPVLEGAFVRAVDAGGCGWHLEGQGEARLLVLDLEKAEERWWDGLLRAS